MKNDVPIKNGIIIPSHELEITASRAGGPGGQHVNKTSTRITIRWNVRTSTVLSEMQKERIIQKLQSQLTNDADLIIHNGSSRSLEQNRKLALAQLGDIVSKALHIPKKRIPTVMSKAKKEVLLQAKKRKSEIKKTRTQKINYD